MWLKRPRELDQRGLLRLCLPPTSLMLRSLSCGKSSSDAVSESSGDPALRNGATAPSRCRRPLQPAVIAGSSVMMPSSAQVEGAAVDIIEPTSECRLSTTINSGACTLRFFCLCT